MLNTKQVNKQISKSKNSKKQKIIKSLYKNRYLYLMVTPVFIYYVIFTYWPMYGAQIAFKNFNPFEGIWGSPWAGTKYFMQFFKSVYFIRLLKNTLLLNIYNLIVGFPAPIILALMLNEIRSEGLKRSIQTIVYLPHFISTVIVVGMIITFLSPSSGFVNDVITSFGGKSIHFLQEPGWFRSIYVWSGVWQEAGWGCIIYLAALVGIDPTLYEAGIVDGANRWQRIIHITIPCIIPTIIIMLILRMGSMFSIGFEKIMLLYNPATYETADVISTYVYRRGIQGAEYSLSTAIGLFNSLINMAMLITFNYISKKTSEVSLW